MIFFIHSGVIDPVQLSMARYECYRLERIFDDEYGILNRSMSYIVLQQSNQTTTQALTDTYPSFYLLSQHGSAITPTRCFVLTSVLSDFTGTSSIENLQLLLVNMCHPYISLPMCSVQLQRFLQALKQKDSLED